MVHSFVLLIVFRCLCVCHTFSTSLHFENINRNSNNSNKKIVNILQSRAPFCDLFIIIMISTNTAECACCTAAIPHQLIIIIHLCASNVYIPFLRWFVSSPPIRVLSSRTVLLVCVVVLFNCVEFHFRLFDSIIVWAAYTEIGVCTICYFVLFLPISFYLCAYRIDRDNIIFTAGHYERQRLLVFLLLILFFLLSSFY